MSFMPSKLGATREETVGKWYKYARWLTTVGWMASGFIFGFIDKTVGFWILLVASFAQSSLVSRENYIQGLWEIRRGGDLMERLLFAGDRKFILERLAKDAVWRGDSIDPEITRQLADIEKEEGDFKASMDQALGILGDLMVLTNNKPEDPKAN